MSATNTLPPRERSNYKPEFQERALKAHIKVLGEYEEGGKDSRVMIVYDFPFPEEAKSDPEHKGSAWLVTSNDKNNRMVEMKATSSLGDVGGTPGGGSERMTDKEQPATENAAAEKGGDGDEGVAPSGKPDDEPITTL
mmetsp:Transcript_40141/g.78140  ORF Transcript_40141/g.78140 Transcript_40141/m.78140 type:complete len:138 (-) Transcript_40141:263-676(-)